MPRPKCTLTVEEKKARRTSWSRNWRLRNPEKNKALIRKQTEKIRQTTVRSTDGIRIAVNKRLRPLDICELCGRTGVKKLDYHHWDDNTLSMGIWVCYLCHRACESFDKELISKYIKLACSIDHEFINKSIAAWRLKCKQ